MGEKNIFILYKMEQTGGGRRQNIFDLIRDNDVESIRSLVETFGKGMDYERMDDFRYG